MTRSRTFLGAMSGRGRYLAALAVVTPLGFLTKFYAGPGAAWVTDHAGGFLYVVFWIALVLALIPRWSGAASAAGVLAVTCALEFAQLWHPPFLERIRATFLGHALLGSTFAWSDFPYYVAGALVGYALSLRRD
jgi:Protein of unknown function (DUF2809)